MKMLVCDNLSASKSGTLSSLYKVSILFARNLSMMILAFSRCSASRYMREQTLKTGDWLEFNALHLHSNEHLLCFRNVKVSK